MRKYILISALSVCLFSSCQDYLDIVPDNVATMDHAFADKVSAERFLATIYSYMPRIGDPQADPSILASDEFGVVEDPWDIGTFHYNGNRIKKGEQNTNNPLMNYWEGANDGRGLFIALRDCNIFLENIHNVGPDLSEEERASWIAEVKFFKAFYHFYLLRMYGPIPLIKDNLPIGSSIDEVKVYREPFEDGIKYVVQLCEEAMPDLPLNITNIASEMGRITRPIAAMLKAEALTLAASPMFNGNPDFKTLIDNRGINLCSTSEDPSKWELAAKACKEAIELCESAGIELYTFTDTRYPMSDTTRLTMSIRGCATEKWNKELIWGNPTNTTGSLQGRTIPYLKTEDKLGSGPNPSICASFKMSELYYSNKGVPIEEDVTYDYHNRYETVKIGADHKYYIQEGQTVPLLNTYREPRFYASLGFDCNYLYGNGRTKDVGMGSTSETSWILKMKQGEMSGKTSDIRYFRSGYFTKKTSNFESAATTTGALVTTRNTFPIMRLADLYLLYAETLNESLNAPNAEVYEYVDKVRRRAGLDGVVNSWLNYSTLPQKPSTKEGMREIIHRERMIELSFEGKRFWDLRRWKKAYAYHNQPEQGWNVDKSTAEEYYKVVVIEQPVYTTKLYLWPIRESELRKNINLVQNPYWN